MLAASKSRIITALNSISWNFRAPLYVPRKWVERYKETVHWKSLNMKTQIYALTNGNLLFNFKQSDHHWKLLKTLDFNTIKASFFVLYTVIPGYFNEFIYEIMKWNISKIKHHSYEVLNLQVYLIVLVLNYRSV